MAGASRGASFEARVHAVVARLSDGDLVSYGEIAALAGRPGAARAVGRVMAGSAGLPWWRVVTRDGRLVPGHEEFQAERLRAEGHTVRDHRVLGFRAGGPISGRGC